MLSATMTITQDWFTKIPRSRASLSAQGWSHPLGSNERTDGLICKPRKGNDGRQVRQIMCGCKSSAGCRWLWRDGLERNCLPKSECDAPIENINWGTVSLRPISVDSF